MSRTLLALIPRRLRVEHARVRTRRGDQLRMAAVLHDASSFHHQDSIGAARQAQAVRDDDCGFPPRRFEKGAVDSVLLQRVNGGSRLVEDNGVVGAIESTRDCHTLPFAAGEVGAAHRRPR